MRNVTPEQVAMAEQHRRGELPDRIEGALGELAGAAKEGLMALSVGVGLGVLHELMAAERQAHAEARRLLMAALERIPPQLEAPSEARESPQTVEEEPERAEPNSATAGSQ